MGSAKGEKHGGVNRLVRTSTYTTTHVHNCLLPFGSRRGASHVSPRRSSRTRTRKIRKQRNHRNEPDERKRKPLSDPPPTYTEEEEEQEGAFRRTGGCPERQIGVCCDGPKHHQVVGARTWMRGA